MTLGRAAALVGVAILVLMANVACSVLYMVVYSYLIDPGHEAQYYNDHVQVAAPYCSIVAGIPLMFLAGWWVAGWWRRRMGIKAALIVWLAYTLIDLGILQSAGLTSTVGGFFAVSSATKLVAAALGGWLRVRKLERAEEAPGGVAG